ncbi:MAG: hypothetical protein ACXWTW_02000 [Methylobacter sp.]
MTAPSKIALRLPFLVRVVGKECQHLNTTDQPAVCKQIRSFRSFNVLLNR